MTQNENAVTIREDAPLEDVMFELGMVFALGMEQAPEDDGIGQYAEDSRLHVLNQIRDRVSPPDVADGLADEICDRWIENWTDARFHCDECDEWSEEPADECATCAKVEAMEASGEIIRFRFYSYDASYFVNGDASGYEYDPEGEDDSHANALAVEDALEAKGYNVTDVADDASFGTPDVDNELGAHPANGGTWLAGDVVTYTAVRSPVVVPDDDPDDDPQTIRVAFRVGDDGDVFALFPDSPADMSGGIVCYMHVGQHSAASPELMDSARAATEAERADLLAELRGIYETDGNTLEVMDTMILDSRGDQIGTFYRDGETWSVDAGEALGCSGFDCEGIPTREEAIENIKAQENAVMHGRAAPEFVRNRSKF